MTVPKECLKTNPQEYPMHPICSSAYIKEAFKANSAATVETFATFFSDVGSAQQKFIDELKKIIPDWGNNELK